MSIHNFINMPKAINNFKRYLQFLIPEEQLREINRLIKWSNKSYLPSININKKFSVLNQLNILKKELLINHKLHHQLFIINKIDEKNIMRKIDLIDHLILILLNTHYQFHYVTMISLFIQKEYQN